MFIDSHCHLDLVAKTETELTATLARAEEQQVKHMLCIGIDKASSLAVLALATRYPQLSASIGIHPNIDVDEDYTLQELIDIAGHQQVIAIGETGLDYFRNEQSQSQQQRFIYHIAAAKTLNKPLIIHTREARKDTLAILKQEDAEKAGAIIHCFTEDWATAKAALDMGFYISLSGIVTFKNAVALQQVAKKLPLDRLLIETDSPYLAPVPHRGKPNEPANVIHVAKYIASLRQCDVAEIAHQTTENFYRLFPTVAKAV